MQIRQTSRIASLHSKGVCIGLGHERSQTTSEDGNFCRLEPKVFNSVEVISGHHYRLSSKTVT